MIVAERLRPNMAMPVAGAIVAIAAIVFSGVTLVASHVKPAAPCGPHAPAQFTSSSTPELTARQMHSLQCMGMPALIPTKAAPGFAGAAPKLSVTASGMMYNLTWKAPDGKAASLMIDHHVGSQLDVAQSELAVNLPGGVTGYWTSWSDNPNDTNNPKTHELGWRDPRTGMWYKINGLTLAQAIAFYKTLIPVHQLKALP
jgi:hypothetical protein